MKPMTYIHNSNSWGRICQMQKHFLLLLFPNKEELIVEALYPQQLKLIEYARKLMNDPVLRWRDKVKMFLHVMVKNMGSRF